ncbi:MAG: glycosyltransferase, partial [Microgenomates group bacterium]
MSRAKQKIKVALVHDYLKEFGGAERVLLALHEIWPEAPIYTAFCVKDSPAGRAFRNIAVVESWFGRLPYCERLISPLRFLIPAVWRSFDFGEYDLIISSASWAITKGLGKERKRKKNFGKQPIEICYCHTPPRYLYGYETSKDWKRNWFVRIYAIVVNHFMRLYDFRQAQKVDFFIANSREVQGRIKKFYRRESVVINPPVEIPSIKKQVLSIKERDSFVTGGRLERPKNFDLIIKACNQLGVPLKIYGTGKQEKYLRSIAGPRSEFLGSISEAEKFKLLAGAKAFVAMAEDEDFGITPVEAMAVGTPVIAFRGGGYLETVIEGKTGVFVEEASVKGVVKGIRNFEAVGEKIKPEDCRRQAEKFS